MLAAAVGLCAGAGVTFAQQIDNVSTTYNATTITPTGYIFADTASSITLLVTNGGKINNSADGFFGNQLGANFNTAIITGSGSEWNNALTMTMGANGASNIMVVANGGVLTSVGNLAVGVAGAYNTLIVTNGGQVLRPGAGRTDIGSNSFANTAIISGAGTLFTNLGPVNVGFAGASNALIVSGGAIVTNIYTTDWNIGRFLGADGNTVIITGPGTKWVGGNLRLGEMTSFNTLVVSNGAYYEGNNIQNISERLFAVSNTVVVTGPGTLFTSRVAGGNNTIKFGHVGSWNKFIVSNGARVNLRRMQNGRTESVNPANGYPTNNVVTITDPGTVWDHFGTGTAADGTAATIVIGDSVGNNGTNNSLNIYNGALVTNANTADLRVGGKLNLGDGTILSKLSVGAVGLLQPATSLNFNNGLLEANTNTPVTGVLIGQTSSTFFTGLGAVNLVGPAFISTESTALANMIECTIMGGGRLTKQGVGNLTLTANNCNTGATIVQAGVLIYTDAGSLGGGDLSINTGAKLQLDYSGNRNVSSLTLGGVLQASGTYSSGTAAAYIAGTGTVTVAPRPTPTLPLSGFSLTAGVASFTFPTVAGYKYRIVYTDDITNPMANWLPVIDGSNPAPCGCGSVATGADLTITDPNAVDHEKRFYRLELL